MTAKFEHELDASVMDGSNLACGAIAGVKTVKNPISLARKVMTETRHVLLAGSGAEVFAEDMEVELVDNSYFTTERRKRQLERMKNRETSSLTPNDRFDVNKYGTVGCVVIDKAGNLAAGTSTGGMSNKKHGRVGDSPIIGAGTYADNKTCAVSATGTGEEFIRFGVARDISAIMEYKGVSLNEAADAVIHGKLAKGDGGIIAVSHTGEIAMTFNSLGMFRGAADSDGRYEIKIWE
jgi:beta-aspartyl-peptidase (threonine type)